MSAELQRTLLSLPCKEWISKQVVALDWYDGPREGVCEMSEPTFSFYFKMIAEKIYKDRIGGALFSISQVPMGTVDQIIEALAELSEPTYPVWVPIWNFSNEAALKRAEKRIEEILLLKTNSNIILHSKDISTFIEWWCVTPM